MKWCSIKDPPEGSMRVMIAYVDEFYGERIETGRYNHESKGLDKWWFPSDSFDCSAQELIAWAPLPLFPYQMMKGDG